MYKQSLIFSTTILLVLLVSCKTVEPPLPPAEPLTKPELHLVTKLGGKVTPENNITIGKVLIDRRTKEVSFPATINMYTGDLEVLIATPVGRLHESLLATDVDPFKLQLALILFGAQNGPLYKGGEIPQGDAFAVDVQVEGGERTPIENWVFNNVLKKPMKRKGWIFVGSNFAHGNICLAREEGNIVLLWNKGNTVFDNPTDSGRQDDYFTVYAEKMPYVNWDDENLKKEDYEKKVTVFLSPAKEEKK